VAGLAGTGDGVGLPGFLARLGLEGRDEAADAELAAGHPHDDLALGDHRRDRHVVAVAPVGDALLPDLLAVLGVERHHAGVERREVDLVAVQSDAAVRRVKLAKVLRQLPLVAPKEVASLGVEGEHLVLGGAGEHHPVVDDRRRLVAFELARRVGPDGDQLRDIPRRDLIQRAVA
jgi:GAF domain-containing protein